MAVLAGIGLGEATEQAYRLLLRQLALTAQELAERQTTSVGQARRALEELVAAGLATAVPGRPSRYTAVDPRTGLAALVHARRAELDRTSAAVESYAEEYHERMLRSDPHRLVEVVNGPSAIADRLWELLAGAKREVLAFDAPPYAAPLGSTEVPERELLARGVVVRAVYASEVLDVPELERSLRELGALGEVARVLPQVPLKMVLVDRRTAMVPLTASVDGTRTTAALVRRSRLCDALAELFEAKWAMAVPLFAAPEAEPHPEVTRDERALLHLLNAGLKDESICRHLGISERTLRRRITGLMERLGATSRFQAGAQAVRRGWL